MDKSTPRQNDLAVHPYGIKNLHYSLRALLSDPWIVWVDLVDLGIWAPFCFHFDSLGPICCENPSSRTRSGEAAETTDNPDEGTSQTCTHTGTVFGLRVGS